MRIEVFVSRLVYQLNENTFVPQLRDKVFDLKLIRPKQLVFHCFVLMDNRFVVVRARLFGLLTSHLQSSLLKILSSVIDKEQSLEIAIVDVLNGRV